MAAVIVASLAADAAGQTLFLFGTYSYRFGSLKHSATPSMPTPGTRQDG